MRCPPTRASCAVRRTAMATWGCPLGCRSRTSRSIPCPSSGPRRRHVTPPEHDRFMTTRSQHACYTTESACFTDAGHRVVNEWWCPVCNAPAHRTRQAGRPRVYCTNACRQRAYRWRRDNHGRLAATAEHPAERASVGIRSHALRSRRDFVSNYSDQRRREVTVCGAFGRPARLGRSPTPTSSPTTPGSGASRAFV